MKKEVISIKKILSPWHVRKFIGLMLFCLLTTSFIFSLVIAEEQTNTHIYFSLSNQTPPEKSSVHEIKQTSPFRADANPSTADYSSYVGKYVSIWIRQTTSGGAPISGATVLFQRSEDGVTWCTYHTGVTGSDGYAYYDHTESCPGVVSYRGADVHGQGATNTFSVGWLQTNPATTCVPIPKCVQKTFSMTCIENYDHICGADGKCCTIGDTFKECDNIGSALKNRSYKQNFYLKDDEVIQENFATDPSYTGNQLTDSAFHYHSGHGADGSKIDPGITATFLQLKKWDWIPNPLAYTVSAGNVENKWGGNNKWVMLDSCNLLKDKNWGKALTTSHGILGYSTDSWVRQDFGDMFFGYAIDQKKPIVEAYKLTTIEIYHSDEFTATVIAKNRTQIYNDQFPGIEGGHMEPDGDPASTIKNRYNWNCRKDGAEWWD
jgi:hypothetical protein